MKKESKPITKYQRKVWSINPKTRINENKTKYNRKRDKRIKENEI